MLEIKKDIIDFLLNNFKEDTDSVCSNIEALYIGIDNISKKLKDTIHDKIYNNEFDIEEFTKASQYLYQIQSDLSILLKSLNIELPKNQEKITPKNIEKPNTHCIETDINKNFKPNMNEHKTVSKNNKKEILSVYDNFDKLSPIAFSIISEIRNVVAGWTDLSIKLVKKLYEMDEELFIEALNNINDDDIRYFSNDEEELFTPEKVIKNLYIETDLTPEQIRKMITYLLEELNIPVLSLKIYVENN